MELFISRLRAFPKDCLSYIFAFFILGLVLVFSYLRSVMALIVNDEGHALTFFHRLLQGDYHSVREVNELFSYILLPIYKLVYKFAPLSDYFVWFSHFLYWSFFVTTAMVSFCLIKPYFHLLNALLISLLFPAYMYYFPVLFYSNLGIVFFNLALWLAFRWNMTNNPSWIPLSINGILLALASISHPGGMVFGSFTLLMGMHLFHKRSIRFYAPLIFSSVLTGLFFMFCTGLTISDFWVSTQHWLIHSKYCGIPMSDHKIIELLQWLYTSSPFYLHLSIIIPVIFFFLLIKTPQKAATFLLFLFIPLIYFFLVRGFGSQGRNFYLPAPVGGASGLIRYLSFWGPIFFLILKKNKLHRCLFFVVWIPSTFASIGMAFTSNTGPGNLTVGSLPAFMVSAIFLTAVIKQLNPRLENYNPALLSAIITILISQNFLYIDFSKLKKTSDAPFKGVYIATDTNRLVTSIKNALKSIPVNKAGRILFQCSPDGFGGYTYLFSSQKPGLRQTFGCQLGEKLCADFQAPYNREITTIVSFSPCSLPSEFLPNFKKTAQLNDILVFEKVN